jgi:hypothetical protein
VSRLKRLPWLCQAAGWCLVAVVASAAPTTIKLAIPMNQAVQESLLQARRAAENGQLNEARAHWLKARRLQPGLAEPRWLNPVAPPPITPPPGREDLLRWLSKGNLSHDLERQIERFLGDFPDDQEIRLLWNRLRQHEGREPLTIEFHEQDSRAPSIPSPRPKAIFAGWAKSLFAGLVMLGILFFARTAWKKQGEIHE